MRDLAATLGTLAPPGSDVPDRVSQLQQQLDQLTFEQINALAEAVDGVRLLATVEKLKTSVVAQQESLILASQLSASEATLTSILDSPAYESPCLPPRGPSATVLLGLIAGRVVLEEAAIVADAICQTVLVVVGEGGNVPGSCVAAGVAKALVVVAQAVLDGFEVCFDSIDSAEIEAAWKNTVVIHGDLSAHDSNLATHDQDIKARLNQLDATLQEIINLLLTPQGRRPGFPQKP